MTRGFLLFVILSLVLLSNGQDATTTPAPIEQTTTTTQSKTTEPTSTQSTTTEATTTQSTTTEATTTQSTTTASTTTESTTTQSTTPESTTTKLITTINPGPTTIRPIPTVPIYEVTDKDGNVCISLQVLASLKIFYTTTNETIASKNFDLKNSKISTSGKCGNETQNINLVWMPENTTNLWHVNVEFGLISKAFAALRATKDTSMYGVKSITFSYYLEDRVFPSTNLTGLQNVSSTDVNFKTQVDGFYSCISSQTILLKAKLLPGVNLVTKDMNIQAFHKGKSHDFNGKQTICESDSTSSNVIPIAIGVLLGALILIALITFIIGSRRRQNNYESI